MAKEYIERNALLRDIEDAVVFSVGRNEPSAELRGAGKIVDRIRCAPAADVVEVVRCRDCVHGELCVNLAGADYVDCELDDYSTRLPHDFCSYGERRDDNAAD